MKVLITGGAGFIGSHLADAHLAAGDEITILDDLSTGRIENIARHRDNPRLVFVEGSILDERTVARLMDGVDRVYHLAAAVGVQYIIDHPLHSLRVNLRGTENVLEAAAGSGRPVFIASTSETYGKNEKVPFSEDDDRVLGSTRISRWGYANSKATDEFFALAFHREMALPVLIGRFFNTVGPRQTGRYGMVIPRFVQAALKNEPIRVYGSGEQTRCFLDVSDAVRFVRALFDKPDCLGGIFNIGSTERISINALARRIIEMTGSRSSIVHVPYEEAFEQGFEDMLHRVPDMSRFRAATGLLPENSLDRILERVIHFYQRGSQQDA